MRDRYIARNLNQFLSLWIIIMLNAPSSSTQLGTIPSPPRPFRFPRSCRPAQCAWCRKMHQSLHHLPPIRILLQNLTEIRWNENEGNFNSLRQKTKSDHRQAAEDHIHTVVLNGLVESLKVKPLDSTSFSSVVNLLHALRRINKRQIGSRRSIHPRIAGELPTQNAAPPPPSPPPYRRGRPGQFGRGGGGGLPAAVRVRGCSLREPQRPVVLPPQAVLWAGDKQPPSSARGGGEHLAEEHTDGRQVRAPRLLRRRGVWFRRKSHHRRPSPAHDVLKMKQLWATTVLFIIYPSSIYNTVINLLLHLFAITNPIEFNWIDRRQSCT